MNKSLRPFFLLLFVLVGIFVFMSIQKATQRTELIPWRTDYDAAMAEAKSKNKPVLLYFTATWCEPCQKMKTTTFANPSVEQALQRYVPIKLDIDQNAAIARQYQVDGIPDFRVLDANEHSMRQQIGFVNSDDIVTWLK